MALATSTAVAPEHVEFGPGTKHLLERCMRQALVMGHNYIGTEHMMLAMLRDEGSPAGQLLIDAGVDSDAAEQWIVGQLRKPAAS